MVLHLRAALADGTYTVQATQSDAAGNTGNSAPATFTVDTTVPAIALGGVPSLTNNATPSFSGSAGTAPGDNETVEVFVHAGGSVAGEVVAKATVSVSAGTWSSTPAHLADGTYTVQATQSDAAGNTGKSVPATFTIDTTAPAVSLNAVSSLTNDSTPTFGGSAGTASEDSGSVVVFVHAGGSVGGEVVAKVTVSVSAGKWSATSTALADGTYTVQATQSDAAGNLGSTTAATFTVDATAPAISLNAVPSLTNDSTPTFGGSAGTASGDSGSVDRARPCRRLGRRRSGGESNRVCERRDVVLHVRASR